MGNYPDLAVKFDLSEDASARQRPRIFTLLLLLLMLEASLMSQTSVQVPCDSPASTILAAHVPGLIKLDAEHPSEEWIRAAGISFCTDWRGKNPAPERMTTVRALWSQEMLYLRFECRYVQLTVFPDAEPNGRRDHLWDRDVAETFLQPDPSRPRFYKEFEVSPNGIWIDLDIGTGELVDLKSGLQRSVWLDEKNNTWTAELAIPMKSLTSAFDPHLEWRANFFRVEGAAEPRHYHAWQPTNTEQPNFHVPQAFGKMRFVK